MSLSVTPSGIFTAVTVVDETSSSANNSRPRALTAFLVADAANLCLSILASRPSSITMFNASRIAYINDTEGVYGVSDGVCSAYFLYFLTSR